MSSASSSRRRSNRRRSTRARPQRSVRAACRSRTGAVQTVPQSSLVRSHAAACRFLLASAGTARSIVVGSPGAPWRYRSARRSTSARRSRSRCTSACSSARSRDSSRGTYAPGLVTTVTLTEVPGAELEAFDHIGRKLIVRAGPAGRIRRDCVGRERVRRRQLDAEPQRIEDRDDDDASSSSVNAQSLVPGQSGVLQEDSFRLWSMLANGFTWCAVVGERARVLVRNSRAFAQRVVVGGVTVTVPSRARRDLQGHDGRSAAPGGKRERCKERGR